MRRGHSSRRRAWLERISLVALDGAAFAAGLRVAHDLYPTLLTPFPAAPGSLPSFDDLALLLPLQVLCLGLVFFFSRLYHQPRFVSRVDLAARLVRAITLGILLTFAAASLLLPGLPYPRILPYLDWAACFACVLGLRLFHRQAWTSLRLFGFGRSRILIVGGGPVGQDLIGRIHRQPSLGYDIVGLVDDTPGRSRARGVPVVGGTRQLGELVERLEVDEVMVALPQATRAELLALINQCQVEGLSIRIFPDVFQMIAGEVQVSALDGLPLLSVRDVALRGWRLTLKRAVDLLLSGIALVLLSPLMLLIAILIKLESRGPAFFVQERVGLDARPFPMIKFRSMRLDAEAQTGAVWAQREDPRRTRTGQFLRRSNLDELPQLINVLLGHMSIVGPRPERPEFVAEFQRVIPRYMERHREKAGITGWAQANGLRGNTSIEERTKYDLYYVENWSLLLDFKIMLKTVTAGFRDPNAY